MKHGSRFRHGLTGSKTHKIWVGMRRRCRDPKAAGYQNYGGRGIRVCSRWDSSFENFYEDMGQCPDEHSIDRIDVDGDYSPENCRWASIEEQNNNRRGVILIKHKGDTLSIRQWARRLGLPFSALYQRYYNGVSAPELFEPIKQDRLVVVDGVKVSVREASELLDVAIPTIIDRDDKGYSVSESRKKSIIIEYKGEAKSLHAWSKDLGINYLTLYRRHQRGETGDRLFSRNSLKKIHHV